MAQSVELSADDIQGEGAEVVDWVASISEVMVVGGRCVVSWVNGSTKQGVECGIVGCSAHRVEVRVDILCVLACGCGCGGCAG